MTDNWDEEETGAGAVSGNAPVVAEMPEVKLFGKWSCDDVNIADMSLQVRLLFIYILH